MFHQSLLPQSVSSVRQNALPWILETLRTRRGTAFRLSNSCSFALLTFTIVFASVFCGWLEGAGWVGVIQVTDTTRVYDYGCCAHSRVVLERKLVCCKVGKPRWLCWDEMRCWDMGWWSEYIYVDVTLVFTLTSLKCANDQLALARAGLMKEAEWLFCSDNCLTLNSTFEQQITTTRDCYNGKANWLLGLQI